MPFKQDEYWIERHKRLRGRLDSVGRITGAPPTQGEIERSIEQSRNDLGAVLKIITPHINGTSAVDLGCGFGRNALAFSDQGLGYTGIDISPEAIEDARSLFPQHTFVVSNLLKYDSGQYDLVVAAWVLVHFVEDTDWLRMLENISKLCIKGGCFLLIDETTEIPNRPPHVKHRPLEKYLEILPDLKFRLSGEIAKGINTLPRNTISKNSYVFVKS